MNYKENVKGERVIAAVLDSIFVGLIVAIPTLIISVSIGLGNQQGVISWNPFVDEMPQELFWYTFAITIIGVLIGILYYVLIPTINKGQTLGKAILSIKVINEVGENPSFKIHFIRAISIWSDYLAVPLLGLYFVSFVTYTVVSSLVGVVIFFIILISLIMVITDQKSQGLHDRLANTFVVDKRYNPNLEMVEAAVRAKEWADIDQVDEDDPFMNQYSNKDKEKSKDPWNE
ncbi:MAG: RDD family protein [Candidatus Izemoplasmataceae bacterium]